MSELHKRIEAEENHLSVEDLRDLSVLNCSFSIQRWDKKELTHRAAQVLSPIDIYSIMNQSDEIKQWLINLFTEFSAVLEKAGETAELAQRLVNQRQRTRDEEMKWMENNKELLVKLAGKWIAIEGNHLVAADDEFNIVLQKAKADGISVPFIIYLPEPTTGSTIGI